MSEQVVPTPNPRGKLRGVAALAWSLVVMELFLLLLVLVDLPRARRAWQVRSWPSSAGTLVESFSTTEQDSEGDSHTVWNGQFSYAVGGVRYEATQRVDRDRAPGTAVTVYYDPANPADAVIQRGLALGSWVMLSLFGGMNAVVLYYWMIRVVRLIREPSRQAAQCVGDDEGVIPSR
jgi:hypothetical protein